MDMSWAVTSNIYKLTIQLLLEVTSPPDMGRVAPEYVRADGRRGSG